MRHSESLANIAPALVKARAEVAPFRRDATNPHFHSRFASLDAISEAVIPALTANGITVLQGGGDVQDDAGIEVVTRLLHASGEWIESGIRLPLAKSDPQGAGSAITYGRRYGLAAILGVVADEDDDAEKASGGADRAARPATRADHETRTTAATRTPEPAAAVPSCPKCGGAMWDNRSGKTNPKAPDFKCRDKRCVDDRGYVTALWESDLERDPTLLAVSAGAFDDTPDALLDQPPAGEDY